MIRGIAVGPSFTSLSNDLRAAGSSASPTALMSAMSRSARRLVKKLIGG